MSCVLMQMCTQSLFSQRSRWKIAEAGPVWDFNQSFGSTFTNSSHVDQWQFNNEIELAHHSGVIYLIIVILDVFSPNVGMR